MRTISSTLLHRIAIMAHEAELQSMEKVASSLTTQIEKNAANVRKSDEFYSYSEDQFKTDVNDHLWDIVIRAADFYGVNTIDAAQMQPILEKIADTFVSEIRNVAGIKHGVGAHEDAVPGEQISRVGIEVSEDD